MKHKRPFTRSHNI